MPSQRLPSRSSRIASTVAAVRPSRAPYTVNLPSRSSTSPPESVPIQRLPARSRYMLRMISLGRPSFWWNARKRPFSSTSSPSPHVPTQSRPAPSSPIERTKSPGQPLLRAERRERAVAEAAHARRRACRARWIPRGPRRSCGRGRSTRPSLCVKAVNFPSLRRFRPPVDGPDPEAPLAVLEDREHGVVGEALGRRELRQLAVGHPRQAALVADPEISVPILLEGLDRVARPGRPSRV